MSHLVHRSIVIVHNWETHAHQLSDMAKLVKEFGGKHTGGARCMNSIIEFKTTGEAKAALSSITRAGKFTAYTMVQRWAESRQFTYNQLLKTEGIVEANAWLRKTHNKFCDHLLTLKQVKYAMDVEDTSDQTRVLITDGKYKGRMLVFVGNPRDTFRVKAYFADDRENSIQLYQDRSGWYSYSHQGHVVNQLVAAVDSAEEAFSLGAAKFWN